MPLCKDVLLYDHYKEFADKLISEAEIICCLDFNALSRIDAMADAVKAAKGKKILIDHHLYPEEFCDITISHPNISSTSELVFRIFTQETGKHDILYTQRNIYKPFTVTPNIIKASLFVFGQRNQGCMIIRIHLHLRKHISHQPQTALRVSIIDFPVNIIFIDALGKQLADDKKRGAQRLKDTNFPRRAFNFQRNRILLYGITK